MRPPLCDICETDVEPDSGLITFLPRESDLEWHERESVDASLGHPPDTVWVCAAHMRVAAAVAPFTTVEQGLAYTEHAGDLDDAQLARAVRSRRGQGVEIRDWERVLRRMIPDLTVEAGGTDVEIDYVDQNTWWERDDNPPQVDEWARIQQWSNGDDSSAVCLYTTTAFWRRGGVAREEAVLMVTPGRDEKQRWQVGVVTPVGSGRVGASQVDIEGEPSPMMVDLLATYGLLPQTSQL